MCTPVPRRNDIWRTEEMMSKRRIEGGWDTNISPRQDWKSEMRVETESRRADETNREGTRLFRSLEGRSIERWHMWVCGEASDSMTTRVVHHSTRHTRCGGCPRY